ncbi:MAG: hypothetical protein JST39_17325, partial [Bacteroidetes bacterium]|nr:hypothetical protein [Bacteroidota bacterium]
SPYLGAANLYDVFYAISSGTNSNGIAGDALSLQSVANNSLTWEITHVTNVGIDFTVLKRRLSVGLDVYQKNTTDLLGSVPLNPWTGRTSLTGNIGRLINKGVELSLRSENIVTKDFHWYTSLTFSYNYNKLVSYSKPSIYVNTASGWVNGGISIVGYNTAPLFAYRFAGLDNMGDPQIYLADKTVTKNPNIAQVQDVVYMGTTRPPVFGGLTNGFGWKGLNLSVNMVYSLGAKMRRDVGTFNGGRLPVSTSFGGFNIQNYFLDRWKKPGDEAITNYPSYVANSSLNYTRRNIAYYSQGDINVISSSFVKVRDVTLSYDLPVSVLRALRIQRFNIFTQATNFMVWKANKVGIDPEYPRGAGAAAPQHSYSMGINLTL